jgi:protein TonB
MGGRGVGAVGGVPGGKGNTKDAQLDGVVGGTGTGSAAPVSLPLKNWNCPWPEQAEAEDFDQQVVGLKVVVAEDGRVEKAEIVSDPGFGFGAAARECARRAKFTPARDAQGKIIKAQSPLINVRFVR